MNHSRYVKGSLLISVLLLPLVLSGQVKEKVTPTLDFTYLKRTDGSKLLQAKLYLFQNRKTYYITDHLVSFFAGTDSITTVQTNSEGDAFLLIQPGAKIPFNKDGTFTFRAAFAGSDTLDAVSTNLSYKDVNLSMHLVLVDSVRTVKVNLSALDARGDSVPVTRVKVGIYVHRMLSLQKIGEDQTDAQGGMSLEFPRDLPGEADGSITVEARVEDNDTYGNVEVTPSYLMMCLSIGTT